MRTAKRIIVGLLLFVLLVTALLFAYGPTFVARSLNRTYGVPAAPVPSDTSALHAGLFVADLHCDATLWNRDLLQRGTYGHVDIPRMFEGNHALQVFTSVTRIPMFMNINYTPNFGDAIAPLVFFQGWPRETWGSMKQRALYEAWRLHKAASESRGTFVVLRSADDLKHFRQARQEGAKKVAGILGIEGLHCLEGDLDNVDVFFRAGFRTMAPTHFFDTEVGGSAHGTGKGGLTPFGEKVIRRMEELGVAVDLAHASPATIADVLRIATRPPFISHTGLRAVCDNNRNISDDILREIANRGGLIGIGFWKAATCGTDLAAIVRSIRHAVDVAGVEHVAFGSDFDGAVAVPLDVSQMAHITEALRQAEFTEDEIRAVAGENVYRYFEKVLPPTNSD